MKKRILSILLAALLVVSLLPVTALAELRDIGDGYMTVENSRMAYNLNTSTGWYDFKGYVDGYWRQVTYDNLGFAAGVYNGEDITVSAAPEFVADGQAIQMTYTVTNNGSAAVENFRFYLAADTAINDNDASANSVDADNVVTMTSSGVTLFALSTTAGGTAVPTAYSDDRNYPSDSQYGPWNSDWVSYSDLVPDGKPSTNVDPSTVHPIEETMDSAFVMYFPLKTLQPGESAEYNFVIGMGSEETIQGIIKQVKAALGLLDYKNEKITGLEPNTTYIFEYEEDGGQKKQYEIKSDSRGDIPLSGKDDSQKDYSFIGRNVRNVRYWEDGSSEEQSQELIIAERRPAPTESDFTIVQNKKDGSFSGITETMEYSIDNGTTWTSGPATLTGLSNETVKVRYRATADSFKSEEYSYTFTAKKYRESDVIVIGRTGKEAGEENPNTGAPVLNFGAVAVVLGAAYILSKKH